MTYDMRRGVAPKIDPTMPRVHCTNHGEVLAQAYLGRERYGCYACASDKWNANEDALAILRAAGLDEPMEPPDEQPGPCQCATCTD